MDDNRSELKEKEEPSIENKDINESIGYISEKKVIAPDSNAVAKDAFVEAKEQRNLEARKQMREMYEDSGANLAEVMAHGVMHKETKADIEADDLTKNFKAKRKAICWVLVLCLLLASVFGVFKYIRNHRTIEGIPAPIQVSIEEAIANGSATETTHSFTVDGGRVELQYLATYDIKGLVVYVDDYDTLWANLFRTKYDNFRVAEIAMPRDISIAWGNVAAQANDFKWGHGYRDLRIEMEAGRGYKNANGEDEVSNNHIIIEPDSELRKKLMKIKNRDYIEIKGYLVSGSFIDERNGYVETFHSSMTRSDTARMITNRITTCEIIYITDIEWLD